METKTVKLQGRQSMRRKTTLTWQWFPGTLTTVSPLKKRISYFEERGRGVVSSVFTPSWEPGQTLRQGAEHEVSQEGFRSWGRMKGAEEETPERWEEGCKAGGKLHTEGL